MAKPLTPVPELIRAEKYLNGHITGKRESLTISIGKYKDGFKVIFNNSEELGFKYITEAGEPKIFESADQAISCIEYLKIYVNCSFKLYFTDIENFY